MAPSRIWDKNKQQNTAEWRECKFEINVFYLFDWFSKNQTNQSNQNLAFLFLFPYNTGCLITKG